MWNQSARSSATSATPSRSSTIPALVVPAVATTPITSDPRGSSRSAARSASPVRRWSSTGTGNVSTPRTWQALPTEEWASSLMAIRGRSGASARRRYAVVSRATMSAERFPAEPPATKHPPAPSGKPACSASTPRAWFSATTTPAASSQEVPWSEEHDTNMSKRSDALVGAAGMKERKRGLSHDTTARASLSVQSSSTWAGSLPFGTHQARQLGVEGGHEAAEVERDRIHGEAFPAGVDDQVGHGRVVVEHGIAHQASSLRMRRPPGLLGPARDFVQGGPGLGRDQHDVVELGLGSPGRHLHADGDPVEHDLVHAAGHGPPLHGGGPHAERARRPLHLVSAARRHGRCR